MDIRHPISSDVQVIRACYNDDAMDLLAVASGDSVEVFQVVCGTSECNTLDHSHTSTDFQINDIVGILHTRSEDYGHSMVPEGCLSRFNG